MSGFALWVIGLIFMMLDTGMLSDIPVRRVEWLSAILRECVEYLKEFQDKIYEIQDGLRFY